MVRFSDCDPAGIAYMPRYIDMLNGVIEDFFPAALGLDYHGFIRGGTGLGYASLHCDFFRPARMGAQLAITPLIARLGGSSVTLTLHVHQGEDEILRASLALVTTSMATSRPIPIPTPLRSALGTYQDRCQ
jgi:4-hydroxybenzoyl-CoA thioesterase